VGDTQRKEQKLVIISRLSAGVPQVQEKDWKGERRGSTTQEGKNHENQVTRKGTRWERGRCVNVRGPSQNP